MMGLTVSHDAFNGSYCAFNRFRQAIALAMGGSFPPHSDPDLFNETWYWGKDYGHRTHPGIFVLLSHSDCEDEISPADCVLVADELEALEPNIARDGGYVVVCRRFVTGCRLAAERGEPLEFR